MLNLLSNSKGMVVALALLAMQPCQAQDSDFSQFAANPLNLNPAFAGTGHCPRFIANYRNQWPAIGNYHTYSTSYDQHVKAVGGGVGLIAMHDRIGSGTSKNTNIGLVYSRNQSIGEKFSLRAAGKISYFRKVANYSTYSLGNQSALFGYFPALKEPEFRPRNGVDFNAGLLGYTEKIFVGFAVSHIGQPNISVWADGNSPLTRKYSAHAGGSFPLGSDPGSFILEPTLLWELQAQFSRVNLGCKVRKGPLIAGLGYQPNESINGMLGAQLDRWRIVYSYGYTDYGLSNQGGVHEVSWALLLRKGKSKHNCTTIGSNLF